MLFSGKMKEKMIASLEVPRDLAYGETLITITGQDRILVENYKSISKLTKDEIIIICVHGRIQLNGKRMEIKHYSPYEMLIYGYISDVILKR